MGAQIIGGDDQRIQYKLENLFDGFADELKMAGEAGAEAIVRTTLAGIAEGDKPFDPYSASYKEEIEAVGGKPQGTVNLRGLFYPQGSEPTKLSAKREAALRKRGALRRAYLNKKFGAKSLVSRAAGANGELVSFTARTRTTRPQTGMKDTLSEMSIDLLKVEATGREITITYAPRSKDYMILHQTGKARGGKTRKWFSADKSAVWAAINKVIRIGLEARGVWFNRPGT